MNNNEGKHNAIKIDKGVTLDCVFCTYYRDYSSLEIEIQLLSYCFFYQCFEPSQGDSH